MDARARLLRVVHRLRGRVPASDLLVLGMVLGVHLVVALLWQRVDTYDIFREMDDFAHYFGVQRLLTNLTHGGPVDLVLGLRDINSYYPLVAHAPLVLMGWLFGGAPDTLRLGNTLYLAILIGSVYGLGRRSAGRQAGLLAAALVTLMPSVFCGWRMIGLDFPALAMTAFAMLMLVKSDGLSRPRDSVWFGVAAGLAILVKGQTLLFLFGPALYLTLRRLVAHWRARPKPLLWPALRGPTLAVLSVLVTTAIWWVGRLSYLAQVLGSHTTGEGMLFHEGDISLLGGLRYYPVALAIDLGAPALTALLLLFSRTLRVSRHRAILLLWLLLPIGIHVVLKVRHYRYLYPLVPVAAVLLGVGLCSLRAGWRRHLAILATVLPALGLWVLASLPESVETALRIRSEDDPKGLRRVLWTVMQTRLDAANREGPSRIWGVPLCGGTGASCASQNSDRLWPDEAAVAEQLAAFLERIHPEHRGVTVYYEVFRTSQIGIMLQRRLPWIRSHSYGHMDQIRPVDPPPGWSMYVLEMIPMGRPPVEAELKQFERPLRINRDEHAFKPVGFYQAVLWRLPPHHPWRPNRGEWPGQAPPPAPPPPPHTR